MPKGVTLAQGHRSARPVLLVPECLAAAWYPPTMCSQGARPGSILSVSPASPGPVLGV